MTDLLVATGDAFARITRSREALTVRTALQGSGVQCLAVDPNDPRIITLAHMAGEFGKALTAA